MTEPDRVPLPEEFVVVRWRDFDRLHRDALWGRAARTLLCCAFALGLVLASDALIGSFVTFVVVLVVAFAFLGWETVGPGGRKMRRIKAEVEEALQRMQSGAEDG